jgi:glutathione S-transferase
VTLHAGESSERATSADGAPVLWHLKVSHYNEKARWALDFKGVRHVRRAVVPGAHPDVALRLTGVPTLPVLDFDGEAIGDSTRIIEALERRHPDPPLYPSDPDARRRALALEDFFDEELGPYTRLLFVHHTLPDPVLFLGSFVPDAPLGPRLVARATFPRVRRRVVRAFAIDDQSVERA